MAEKRVSVRLVAEGGRQVRAELEGVGEAGARGFGRLSREMDMANARVAAFARRATVAAAAATAALAAAGVAMIRSGLQTVDAQAKMAQSLGTTVASLQVMERAGDLAGVSMGQVEQATVQLTRRLSQAAAGTGPAGRCLGPPEPLSRRAAAPAARCTHRGHSGSAWAVCPRGRTRGGGLAALRRPRGPGVHPDRHGDTAPGDRGCACLRGCRSEADADQIERTNDAISRLGLIWRGSVETSWRSPPHQR